MNINITKLTILRAYVIVLQESGRVLADVVYWPRISMLANFILKEAYSWRKGMKLYFKINV